MIRSQSPAQGEILPALAASGRGRRLPLCRGRSGRRSVAWPPPEITVAIVTTAIARIHDEFMGISDKTDVTLNTVKS
jgi:hypothetical protein